MIKTDDVEIRRTIKKGGKTANHKTQPIALAQFGEATRQHFHAVIRTPNGNDYGKDLLLQHLAEHPH